MKAIRPQEPGRSIDAPSLYTSLFCLGASALITQVLTLREFLNLFAGNELVLGAILTCWLLLTGAGMLCGRRAGRLRRAGDWLMGIQAILALLPSALIVCIRLSKALFPAGITPGLGSTFLISLLLLFPYCSLAGFALVLCTALTDEANEVVGKVYAVDALGGLAGGLLFGLLLVSRFTPMQVAGFLLVLNAGAACLLAMERGHRLSGGVIAAGALAVLLVGGQVDLERISARSLFPTGELLGYRSTPYGLLATVRQGRQLAVYENGLPLGTTDDALMAEETVHFGLSQHPRPERVLLVGGGLEGAIGEIEKHGAERIDWVELDPALIELAGKIGVLEESPDVRPIAADARRLIGDRRGEYDAVLVALPFPSTAQLNRYYTVEFFQLVRRALRPGGILSIGVGGGENYLSARTAELAASVYRSLHAIFARVLIVPGSSLRLVASERALDYRIAERLAEKGIETRYVNADYLEGRLSEDRLKAVEEMVKRPAPLNRDFAPTALYAHLRQWLDRFGGGLLLPALLLLGVALLIWGLLVSSERRPVLAAVGASGLVGMGLEVLLLLAYQICFGQVYADLSLLITAFMGGAATGAIWGRRLGGESGRSLLRLDGALALAAFLMGPLLAGVRGVEAVWMHPQAGLPLFGLLIFGIGFLVGGQLPVAARSLPSGATERAGRLFALDLLGASVGALLIGTCCIPLLGLERTCYLLGAIKAGTAVWLWRGTAAEERRVEPGRALAFSLTLFSFAALGGAIVAPDAGPRIYAFIFHPAYAWMGVLLLGVLLVQGMRVRFEVRSELVKRLDAAAKAVFRYTRVETLRWMFFAAFAPAVFYPIFRCYFKLPFLFCHVCPRLCIFGYLRPYLVPAALLANLERRHWCHNACPLGTLHDCQIGVRGQGRRFGRWFFAIPLLVLTFTAASYFEIGWDMEERGMWPGDWYTLFFKETFAVSWAVIGIALLLLVVGFVRRRPFCESLCPVGAFSELLMKGERRLWPQRVEEDIDVIPN